MKELSDYHDLDKAEIHARKQEERQKQYLGSLRYRKTHTVWELDLTTREIRKAEYKPAVANFASAAKGAPGTLRHELVVKENCLYEVALNLDNARKKFIKRLFSHFQKHVA
jgi:hypothetical protein